jgi:hypothetical protein
MIEINPDALGPAEAFKLLTAPAAITVPSVRDATLREAQT